MLCGWVVDGTIKIDTWPCNDFQFNVVTCVAYSPPTSKTLYCLCDVSEHLIWEPFTCSLVSRCPEPGMVSLCRSWPGPGCLYLVSSNVQSCRWSYFLYIFLACSRSVCPARLIWALTSVSLPKTFVVWLRLRASLKCAQLLPFPLFLLSGGSMNEAIWKGALWSSGLCILAFFSSACGLQQP